MANIIKRVWNQNRMVQIEDLKGMTFQAEQAGHTFQISGIDDDGNTVVLTGTPSGVLLRPDNTDVALTCSVSGGVVSATLPANCYDVPGRFGLTIFITSGSSKTAIYAAVGTVTRTSSGTVAPGTSQSVVDLINAINAAVNSIPASYSALLADIAPTYSDSALYSVGQYAWYDGDLKRCIVPITTAESYTAAHWTSAVLGQDVSDLKSALNHTEGKVVGLYADAGATAAEIAAINNFESIEITGTFTGDWKVGTVYNTESIPKRIIVTDGTRQSMLSYNSTTGYNLGAVADTDIVFKVKYDWDNHGSNVNLSYADSSIRLVGESQTTINARLQANNESTQSQADETNRQLGMWEYEKAYVDAHFPFIQINKPLTKIHFKLLEPTTNVNTLTIYASNNWSGTQTSLFTTSLLEKKEFDIEIDPTGYSMLRFVITLIDYPVSGTYRAIIHGVDDFSVTQTLLQTQAFAEAINNNFNKLYVQDSVLMGTNYNKFYLNTQPYHGISQINNDVFNLRAYSVTAGQVYILAGQNVSLNASLPLAAFGIETVEANHSYLEKLLDGTTTATDYFLRYVPPVNGYIYIAWVKNKEELKLFSTELVSDKYVEENPGVKQDITIQLFGDSITDNQWGDMSTWANYIVQNLPDYNVTVYNDAVGGSGIGHGKSSGTTGSHQEDEYNYVWDLVTDGITLKTNANYIVILVGTNNWASGTDLGDMSSNTNATIYGALKLILEYISQHSAATVFVCTIPQRYNTTDQGRNTNVYGEPLNPDGVTLAEYCEPFRKLSAFYGMPCVHLNEALGWNRLNISSFCGDGLHPNAKGDKMLAAFICAEINKHIGKVNY